MTPRFEKAYNALLKGFFEGTLGKGDCICCAVGNIVADAQGATIKLEEFGDETMATCTQGNNFWMFLFTTRAGYQSKNFDCYPEYAIELERLTGYNAKELALVEYAFETNAKIPVDLYQTTPTKDIIEDQYNGLCAVVDVLLSLDTIEEQPAYKAKFREHKNLQPC